MFVRILQARCLQGTWQDPEQVCNVGSTSCTVSVTHLVALSLEKGVPSRASLGFRHSHLLKRSREIAVFASCTLTPGVIAAVGSSGTEM